MSKCQGILGWILGHKFRPAPVTDPLYTVGHCLRCGRKAGWTQ